MYDQNGNRIKFPWKKSPRKKSPRKKSPWKKSPRKKSPRKNPPEKIPLNAVEREPVPTRVLNPNASEASYKPKQRSYRKTKLKKIFFLFLLFFGRILSGGFYPGTDNCPYLSCKKKRSKQPYHYGSFYGRIIAQNW